VKEAGKAFERAAEVQTKNLNDPDDAANTMLEAYKVYRTEDPKAAIRCLDTAIQRYCAKGNFRRAATHKEHMAETCEQMQDTKAAMDNYEQAAEWFESDNAMA
jgi:alpha-soluble NSF attachment protein